MREPSREAREAAEAISIEWDETFIFGRWLDAFDLTDPLARALDDFAEKREQRLSKELSATARLLAEFIDERDALRRRVAQLEAEVDELRSDVAHVELDRDVAEAKVSGDWPEPHIEQARDERDHWKARAEAAESALDEIAELDPEELDENDDEWGGAAVGGRAQEIAQEARRGRGDSVRASLPTRTENRP